MQDGGIKVGPFGGSGGAHFDMGAADHLVSIGIGYGAAIDVIVVTYDINGKRETRRFGRGEAGATITFQREEYLTEVSGYFGNHEDTLVVRSLTFYSQLGNNRLKHGPYGEEKEKDTRFSVPVVNGRIVGFFGYSGELVDAIGVSIVQT